MFPRTFVTAIVLPKQKQLLVKKREQLIAELAEIGPIHCSNSRYIPPNLWHQDLLMHERKWRQTQDAHINMEREQENQISLCPKSPA